MTLIRCGVISSAATRSSHDTDTCGAAWLALLLSPLAASAIVLRLAIYCHLSFRTACALLLVASVLVVCGLGMWFRRTLLTSIRLLSGEKGRAAIYMAALACVIVSVVVTCLHRADIDDEIYLPKTVYYLAYPSTRMDGVVHEIVAKPVIAYPAAAAPYYPTSYEFAQAAVAHFTGINLQTVYYVIFPMLAGVVGVLSLIYCLRLLGCESDAASCAVLIMIPLILLMGETARSLGNVTLLRVFQSKFAFFWFGLPIFIDLTLIYFREANRFTWVSLLVAAMALAGITSSALIMLPLFAVILALAWQATWIGQKWFVKQSITYGLSLFPVIGFALDYRRFALQYAGYESKLNAGFPADFLRQLEFVYGSGVLPTTIIIVGLALLVCLVRPKRNAFLFYWMILAFLLLLNPIVSPWIMKYLTTQNIYWRLFYLLPSLPLLGVACAQLLERLGSTKARSLVALTVCMAFTATAFGFPTSTLRKANSTHIGLPGPTQDVMAPYAEQVIKLAPAGVMLAPFAISQEVVMLSARHPQITTRMDFMANIFQFREQEYARRVSASQFLMGEGGRLADVTQILQDDSPRTVVLLQSAMKPDLAGVLQAEGFQLVGQAQPWQVYARREPPGIAAGHE